jgi:Fe-S-cluster containining protein
MKCEFMDGSMVGKKPEWKCIQCGRCCFMYGCMVPASNDDLARWEKEGRTDILNKAKVIIDPKTGRIIAAELWFDPHTRKEYIYCPWITSNGKEGKDKRVTCQIHSTKPQYCRDYICRKHVK